MAVGFTTVGVSRSSVAQFLWATVDLKEYVARAVIRRRLRGPARVSGYVKKA